MTATAAVDKAVPIHGKKEPDRSANDKPRGGGGGGALTVAVFGLIGVAAVLMVVLLLILAFMLVTALAPDVLR